jgi:hypothetical protein
VKVYIEEEIATIKKHRRSKFTQHILPLSLPLNSILCLLNEGFVSIIVANNLRKCNRKKWIWSSAAEQGMLLILAVQVQRDQIIPGSQTFVQSSLSS